MRAPRRPGVSGSRKDADPANVAAETTLTRRKWRDASARVAGSAQFAPPQSPGGRGETARVAGWAVGRVRRYGRLAPPTTRRGRCSRRCSGHEAWAVIRLRDSATVTLVGGAPQRGRAAASTYRSRRARPSAGRRFDRLVAIPFRQVAERGFEAHDDGTPLTVVDIEPEREVAARRAARGAARRGRSTSPTAAASTPATRTTASWSSAIIRDEIGNGEGANLVDRPPLPRAASTTGTPTRR